jgi:hypothetical protein
MLSQLIPIASGAWTPTLAFATPGTSSFAYATQTGSYRRQGSLATVTFELVFTPTVGTGSGALQISTLPYAATAAGTLDGIVRTISSQFTWPTSATMLALEGAGVSVLRVAGMGSAINNASITAALMTNAAEHTLAGVVTYITA